jgi:5-methyltetrahydropteroyltriglutamate--homocysteine methyltransferase
MLLMKKLCFRISEEEYTKAIKEEISKVVKIQEELDIDVLVHGEPEVSILVSLVFQC